MGQEPEIVGVWDYSSGKEDYKLIIAEEDGEMVLIKKFENGIVIKQVVTISRRSDGVVYQPEDKDAEEYYLINEAGDMQIWDVLGLKETLQADQ
ncbi:MAG: hypothetical protein RQ753_06035 [Desulfurivibrionaceae bacterium]|nr:hypothetical protein [Desulfobulbales bacterium]MDT8335235.1 hypothetical protein [Desulfurivibrionaceae bacterium]